MASLFDPLLVCQNLVLGSPASTDISASAPYTREKGISPVLDFGVVDLAWPFAHGWYGIDRILLILLSSRNYVTLLPMNCLSLSHVILDGIPNRHTMCSHIKLMTSFSLIFSKVCTSTHFEK